MIIIKSILNKFNFRLLIILTAITFIIQQNNWAMNSSFITQVIPLLPSTHTIIEVNPNTTYADFIDQIVYQILTSNKGSQFCGAVDNDYKNFQKAFFIGDGYAQKAYRQTICSKHFTKKIISKLYAKKYILITTDDENFLADGWTTALNETYIFITNHDLKNNSDRIKRTIIHELAISLDKKEQIGFLGKIDFPNLGIEISPNSCELLPLIRDVYIKHALSSLRAFDIEDQIMSEEKNLIPLVHPKISCIKKLKSLAHYLLNNFNYTLSIENNINLLLDSTLVSAKCDSAQYSHNLNLTLNDKIKKLSQLQLNFNNGTSEKACDYLSSGFPFYPGASFRGGPSPRIGGGGWNVPEVDSHE